MFIYKVKVKYDEQLETYRGVCTNATNFNIAMNDITQYYGEENITDVMINEINADDIAECVEIEQVDEILSILQRPTENF